MEMIADSCEPEKAFHASRNEEKSNISQAHWKQCYTANSKSQKKLSNTLTDSRKVGL